MESTSKSIPLAPRATLPFFYKYSALANAEQIERLRVIIQNHELYLPSLEQLNDPADGRPRLAPLTVEQMISFLCDKLEERRPDLSAAELERERRIIGYNIPRYPINSLNRILTDGLHKELSGYRVYSMSKRYDNLSLWAKYAGDHSGYCMEFENIGPLFENARDVIYESSLFMDVTNREHTNGFWFFCKRPEWSNEEEIRLVLPRGKGTKFKIEPQWFTRLILGKNVSEENERVIRAFARQRDPQLTVVRAHYDTVQQQVVLGP